MNTGLILGIDICDDFSQISFYNYKDKEPESVGLSIRESKYQIPTAVCKQKGGDEWYAGDDGVKCSLLEKGIYVDRLLTKINEGAPVTVEDLTVMPVELLTIFMKYLITAAEVKCQKKEILKVYVTLSDFNPETVKAVKASLKELNIKDTDAKVMNHIESYLYYAMNQKKELWSTDVGLLDYTEQGLEYHKLYMANLRGKKIVMVEEMDLREEFPYDIIAKSETAADDMLLKKLKQLFDKKIINTVYLTGVAFAKEEWAKESLKFLCNKRRVFKGQNLYTKGACYAAADDILYGQMSEYLIACRDRITTRVQVAVSGESEKDGAYTIVPEGVNWSEAGGNFDFILNGEKEVKFYLTPADSGMRHEEVINLDTMPHRPDRCTRIGVEIKFTSDSKMKVLVRDKGFGEFFRGSNRVISSEIIL